MKSSEILDAVMAKLHAGDTVAEYYFAWGKAIVKVDGHVYEYPMLNQGDREAQCADLLVNVLADLLPTVETTNIHQLDEHTYSVTRLDRRTGRNEILHLDPRTFDARQRRRWGNDLETIATNKAKNEQDLSFGAVLRVHPEGTTMSHAAQELAANETIHLLPRIG